jgi:hypothetical protein
MNEFKNITGNLLHAQFFPASFAMAISFFSRCLFLKDLELVAI